MSTQPMSEATQVQSPMCDVIDFLGRICKRCSCSIDHMRSNATHCSRKCQKHSVREETTELLQKLRNVAFAHINRDKAFTFDGRYEGSLNQPITLIVMLRKDHGYHPMPIDVHVRPVEAKYSRVTPEDHDWAMRQRAFDHSQNMPRSFNNFCTHCAEMVIDKSARSVRVTRGVYLPIRHQCNSVRVYDLAGKLLEVKSL
jgi:hypothetical protein